MFPRLILAAAAIAGAASLATGIMLAVWTDDRFLVTRAIALAAVAVPLGALAAFIPARQIVQPFRDIRAGADRIASGDYGYRIHGEWREGRELARSFNEMGRRLSWEIGRLETDHEQLKTILQGMVEGVIAVSPAQRVLFANEAAGRMLGFDPAVALARPLWESSRQPTTIDLIARTSALRQPTRFDVETDDPGKRYLSVYAAPVMSRDGTGAVLVLHDISELRRLEQIRQDFTANVSHELKTPLAVIKACVETLIDGAVDEPEMRGTFLQQISDQGDRLNALILDLIGLARIESSEQPLEIEALDVASAVDHCLERHRPRADARGIRLIAAAPNEEVRVSVDDEALRQILDNLVDNAVKYHHGQGWVKVGWQTISDTVVMTVADDGPGISERDLPRIFERFYRVDKARSRELGSTGLGLAIVKHLVQAMHGSVKATGELGKGLTMTVTLPRAAVVRDHSSPPVSSDST